MEFSWSRWWSEFPIQRFKHMLAVHWVSSIWGCKLDRAVICSVVLVNHILQLINVLVCIISCKILPHDPFHGPIPSFSYTGFFFIFSGIQGDVISIQYSSYMLIIEFCPFICPKSTQYCNFEQFRQCCSYFFSRLVFQWDNPPVFTVDINHCQQELVASIRSG